MNVHGRRASQRGAVLLVALVMLLVLTLLAVGSMRGTTLQTRITANRALDTQQQNAADAALRESEFRYYGPANLADKLEGNRDNCKVDNTLSTKALNKPCLLAISNANTSYLLNFVDKPWLLNNNYLNSESVGGLLWMPYRGTDPANRSVGGTREPTDITQATTLWNSTLIAPASNTATNAEDGMRREGKGTYYYLNNAKADDTVYLQSTHANTYMGLNN